MERAYRAGLSALPGAFVPVGLHGPGPVMLDEETAHHLRVRRLELGDEIRVVDGCGMIGRGRLVALGKRAATVEVAELHHEPPPAPVRLLVPIADRERMLWLAEKSAEFGLRRWTPVRWERSRSVSPRGEGELFRAKVRARMIAALVQSGGSWLPAGDVEHDGSSFAAPAEGERAGGERAGGERAGGESAGGGAAGEGGLRLLLDADGPPLLSVLAPLLTESQQAEEPPLGVDALGVTVALGPEGGLTPEETATLVAAGYRRCALGSSILRFETAAVAALALVEAARSAARPSRDTSGRA